MSMEAGSWLGESKMHHSYPPVVGVQPPSEKDGPIPDDLLQADKQAIDTARVEQAPAEHHITDWGNAL